MRVVLATGNPGKVAEISAILAGVGWAAIAQTELGLRPVEETGASFAENARLKAVHAARASGLAALADDSGLEVDALGGLPGVHSARYAGPMATDDENNAKLLAALKDVATPRTARFRCAIVLVRGPHDPDPVEAEGVWDGQIALAARGSRGFGYDALFLPDDVPGCTAAEITLATKNALSHRGQALERLRRRLTAETASGTTVRRP